MRPGANRQVRLLPRLAQTGVVGQDLRQEDVIPAAEQGDGRRDRTDGIAEIDRLPPGVIRCIVNQPILVEPHRLAGSKLIGFAQREVESCRLFFSLASAGGEDLPPQPLFLMRQ